MKILYGDRCGNYRTVFVSLVFLVAYKYLFYCYSKGVDNLLNLVVELYKQQKTVRAFESSVRSLRDDIMRELNVPKYKKQYASKKVREEIERTAKNRLHGEFSCYFPCILWLSFAYFKGRNFRGN